MIVDLLADEIERIKLQLSRARERERKDKTMKKFFWELIEKHSAGCIAEFVAPNAALIDDDFGA